MSNNFYLLKPYNETDDNENDENAKCQQYTQSYDVGSTRAWI